MREDVIKIEGLHKAFKSKYGNVSALEDINLEVKQGEILGIIGFSGAGKSTLLRCINALERPDGGKITVLGQDVLSLKQKELMLLRRKTGMIFQNFNLLQQKNVIKNVTLPLEISGYKKNQAISRAEELLNEVGLSDKIKDYPSRLSGGQQQRVAIARALALDPEILLCDEATSALDAETTFQILSLIRDVNAKRKLTTVIVTHQLEVVKRTCDRVVVLEKGKICEIGKTSEIFQNPQSDATKRLVAYGGNL